MLMVRTAFGKARIVISAAFPERLSVIDDSVYVRLVTALGREFALQFQTS